MLELVQEILHACPIRRFWRTGGEEYEENYAYTTDYKDGS
jgi:hypothetical protein